MLLFCRDFFEYPELEGNEMLCNHLAPKLQGRPRKKIKNSKFVNTAVTDSINAAIGQVASESESSDEIEETTPTKPLLSFKKIIPGNKPVPFPHNKSNALRAMDRKGAKNLIVPITAGKSSNNLGRFGGHHSYNKLLQSSVSNGSDASNRMAVAMANAIANQNMNNQKQSLSNQNCPSINNKYFNKASVASSMASSVASSMASMSTYSSLTSSQQASIINSLQVRFYLPLSCIELQS